MHYVILFAYLLTTVTAQITTDRLLTAYRIDVDKHCVQKNIGLTTYENIVQCYNVLPKKDSPEKDYEKFCQHSPMAICPSVILLHLDVCLTNTQKQHLTYYRDGENAMRDILCANDAEAWKNYSRYAKKNDTTCEEWTNYNVSMCVKDFNYDIKLEEMFKEDRCRALYEINMCLNKEHVICDDKRLYQLLRQSDCAYMNATPCKQYIHECESEIGDVTVNDNFPEPTLKPGNTGQGSMVNFSFAISFSGLFPLSNLKSIFKLT